MARIDARLASKARFSERAPRRPGCWRRSSLSRSRPARSPREQRHSWIAGGPAAARQAAGRSASPRPSASSSPTTTARPGSGPASRSPRRWPTSIRVGAPPADRLLRALAADGALLFGRRIVRLADAPGGRSPARRSPTSSPIRPTRCASWRRRRLLTDGGGAALAAVYASNDGGTTFGAAALHRAGRRGDRRDRDRAERSAGHLPDLRDGDRHAVTTRSWSARPTAARAGRRSTCSPRSAPPSSGSSPSTAPTPISSTCASAPRPRRRWR